MGGSYLFTKTWPIVYHITRFCHVFITSRSVRSRSPALAESSTASRWASRVGMPHRCVFDTEFW